MISPRKVSAVLVTKGDVDLTEITDSIQQAGIRDIVVWDNSVRENLSCYGRYEGIGEARHQIIYHQDDDLVVANIPALLVHYRPVEDRHTIVANNRIDEEWPLTAIGCLFHRDLAGVLDAYEAEYGGGPDFHRVCDVPFAYMNGYRRVHVGYRDLPWGTAPDRMYQQPGHMQTRELARARAITMLPL